MSDRFHIGGLARRCGRSVHTIRWYEAQGLIPRVGRDAGGRRVYEAEHLDHLIFLERMRRTGMSVAEMRRLTELSIAGWRTLGDRQALLLAHRQAVEEKIADLKAALELIDAKTRYYAEWAVRKKRPPPPAEP
ncbi:MerR family transcriptional regulator [Phenylobacterium sp.]|uniref:MerR family transcriptional regulator n=1 Tax=Phenylobacterium sp. TaxID=1871053 RepID=UPI002B80AE2E|nr:MerR family transcriptional regulator [Phenylobacterium sp.]HVI32985.1 MerR family transcriptional regulator [Phenylobacterium sp.]